ncbi:MAG: HlyD family efflux transporter periplasmic adaptor subunit [Candidatus Eisenbacteria bacterium]
MNRSARRLEGAPGRRLSAAVIGLLALLAASCASRDGISGSGTLEMDEVDIASLSGGRLIRVRVSEGDLVRAGDTLAVLDRGELVAELAAQAARAQSATAQFRDLQSGARPEEVLAARADVAAARAGQKLAQADFERAEKLVAAQAVSEQELDRARATRDAANARVRAATENLHLRETGFRRQQVSAARDAAAAAAAQLEGARSRAGELVLTAPISGIVLLKNFEAGEVVQAGAAVLTLGNPDSLWMRVFIAAPKLTAFRLGAAVGVRPIGATRDYPGRVVEIASQAEFTPRAALTEDEQANLVFGVKVALAPSSGVLKAGLPADARIQGLK